MNICSWGPKWANGLLLTKLEEELEKSRDGAFIEGFDGCRNKIRKLVVGSGDLNGSYWGSASGIVGGIIQRRYR